MENTKDPRIQIPTDLETVQQEIEKAAKERRDQIRNEAKDELKSVKEEAKELKDDVDNNFKGFKGGMKDSELPYSREVVSTAKEASKVIKKGIDADLEESQDRINFDRDQRINSIDNMLDESNDRRR